MIMLSLFRIKTFEGVVVIMICGNGFLVNSVRFMMMKLEMMDMYGGGVVKESSIESLDKGNMKPTRQMSFKEMSSWKFSCKSCER